MVVLFFLIINSFLHENMRLVDQNKAWQAKLEELEEKGRQLEAENKELERILMPGRPGLIINDLNFKTLTFSNTHRLSYEITLTLENKLNQPLPEGKAHLLLAFGLPGTTPFQRTSWQQMVLPPFQSGQRKIISLTGETLANPGEEILLVVLLDQQPGVAKLQVRLGDLNGTERSLP